MANKKSTGKLTPGSFKSGNGSSKASTRRTGRTAGTSQSAFAGYGFQGNQPSAQPPVKKASDDSAEETPETDAREANVDKTVPPAAEVQKSSPDDSGDAKG